jgi:hypothetical protein
MKAADQEMVRGMGKAKTTWTPVVETTIDSRPALRGDIFDGRSNT